MEQTKEYQCPHDARQIHKQDYFPFFICKLKHQNNSNRNGYDDWGNDSYSYYAKSFFKPNNTSIPFRKLYWF